MNRTMTSLISMGVGAAATYAMSNRKRMNTRKMKKNLQRSMRKMFD
ncbi:DUF3918 domain-containing protein [Bacillus mangrovi]|uniref:DUF3918 domain-containing protein n=1 Tax=Metabacillus mangrovi TaxID=1491830 RepID=A0A7X2V400_9BACI|nr:YrzQ family protein [Metabacillus mangrovi]MTH52528.1 DUF3918 domain-containing protein [Metabacillus mangrovi]